MKVLDQFERVIGYQFVRTTHFAIITSGYYKANRLVSQH
jgi:hypothetical protein